MGRSGLGSGSGLLGFRVEGLGFRVWGFMKHRIRFGFGAFGVQG